MSWPSVEQTFVTFSTPLEGDELNPYNDGKGYPTVAIGCLIWPAVLALGLGWVLPDGSLASDAEVLRQINALHAQPGLAEYRADSPRVLDATTIRLTPKGVMDVVHRRFAENDAAMAKAFRDWAQRPADFQLCMHSMCWAVGNGWTAEFGNAMRSLLAGRYIEAIVHMPDASHPGFGLPAEIDISTKNNPGIVPRNAQNELLLSNAQVVVDRKLDPSVLHWPKSPLNDGTVDYLAEVAAQSKPSA